MIWGVIDSLMPTSLRSIVLKMACAARRRVLGLAGNERHVLADHDLGLLVVHGENVRRGEHVHIAVGLERVQERADIQIL